MKYLFLFMIFLSIIGCEPQIIEREVEVIKHDTIRITTYITSPTINIIINRQPANVVNINDIPVIFSVDAYSTLGLPLTYRWINTVFIPTIIDVYVPNTGIGLIGVGNNLSYNGLPWGYTYTFACLISDSAGNSIMSNTFTYKKYR